jgi:DNA-directed RNA polymerase subunit M/transcription elongation factor TFIIS
MNFCKNCDNLYYIRLSEEDGKELKYYCKKCGHVDDSIVGESVIVSKTNVYKNEEDFNHLINEYTKFDPTLPRVDNIPCPNSECGTNKEMSPDSKEVIVVRYNESSMKYLYICNVCEHIWKN